MLGVSLRCRFALFAVCIAGGCVTAAPSLACAQAPAADSEVALLDKLAGHWVMRGTIGKRTTTHDVDAQWVLNREYLQFRETSRERGADGKPQYEAIVYIAWDAKAGEWKVLWLDNTAQWNFRDTSIGHGKPADDAISLVFIDPPGEDHTTFRYDRVKRRWTLSIDNVQRDSATPFARLTLTRQ